ncbi:MAG: cell division FtsA domain-containing protein [Pseudomonadota bacterium]
MVLPRFRDDEQVIGVIDVGSSKIATLIMAVATAGAPDGLSAPARVVGSGIVRARGVRSGLVTGVDAAEAAIRASLSEAERSAGFKLEEVSIATTAGRLAAERFSASADIESGAVRHDDIRRLHAGAARYASKGGRTPLSLRHATHKVDGNACDGTLIGVAGTELASTFEAITADESAIRTLLIAITRNFVDVRSVVPAAFASAQVAATADERENGVIVADLGAETITCAGFTRGQLVWCAGLATGGRQVSLDLARAFDLRFDDAERLKVLGGTLVRASETRSVSVGSAGKDGMPPPVVPHARLVDVISKRVVRQIGLLQEQIAKSPFADAKEVPVVLTGGASRLPGLGFVVANALGRPARLGAGPEGLLGPELAGSASALSAVVGLKDCKPPSRQIPVAGPLAPGGQGYMSRLQSWVQASF